MYFYLFIFAFLFVQPNASKPPIPNDGRHKVIERNLVGSVDGNYEWPGLDSKGEVPEEHKQLTQDLTDEENASDQWTNDIPPIPEELNYALHKDEFFEKNWKNYYKGPLYYNGPTDGPKISLKVGIELSEVNRGPLNSSSCLYLQLVKVPLMDQPAIIHYEKYIRDVENMENPHIFEVAKPKLFPAGFRILAVLNSNWCSEGSASEWIRPGDYLNTMEFAIQETDEKSKFVTNVKLVLYVKV